MGAKAADKVIEEFLKAAENASESGKDGNVAAEKYVKNLGKDIVYGLLKEFEEPAEYERLEKDEILARMRLFGILFDKVTDRVTENRILRGGADIFHIINIPFFKNRIQHITPVFQDVCLFHITGFRINAFRASISDQGGRVYRVLAVSKTHIKESVPFRYAKNFCGKCRRDGGPFRDKRIQPRMDFFSHTILKENKRLKPLPSLSNISLINKRNKLFFAER